MNFASDTSVSVGRSKDEIESMVQRAGGTRFATLQETGKASVLFELADRRIMFELKLPAFSEFATRVDKRTGRTTAVEQSLQQRNWEQACRSRWRALTLAIKAKLVSVDSEIESLEEAFLAHIMVPTKSGFDRFSKTAIKAIHQAYISDKPPALMLGSGS